MAEVWSHFCCFLKWGGKEICKMRINLKARHGTEITPRRAPPDEFPSASNMDWEKSRCLTFLNIIFHSWISTIRDCTRAPPGGTYINCSYLFRNILIFDHVDGLISKAMSHFLWYLLSNMDNFFFQVLCALLWGKSNPEWQCVLVRACRINDFLFVKSKWNCLRAECLCVSLVCVDISLSRHHSLA